MTLTTSSYNDHRIRKAILRRHEAAFQDMGLGCPRCPSARARRINFLAEGLAVSSLASLHRGRRWRATALVLRALLLSPSNKAYRQHFVRCLLPTRIRERMRGYRRRLRGQLNRGGSG